MLVLGVQVQPCDSSTRDLVISFIITSLMSILAVLLAQLLLLPDDRWPTYIELYRAILIAVVTSGVMTAMTKLVNKGKPKG